MIYVGSSVRSFKFGEAGIRTLDTLAGITVFETAAIDHSATSPKSSKNIARAGL